MFPALLDQPFSGFGPSTVARVRRPARHRLTLSDDRRADRRELRTRCPAAPGVYGMIDRQGRLIYVGKSKSLRHRLGTYLQSARPEEKSQRIIASTNELLWETAGSEFGALLRELELIRRWQPSFNVWGRPDRARRAYLCLGGGAAPQVYLAPQLNRVVSESFGLVPANRRARRAIRWANECFGLRDCQRSTPVHFSDQQDLFPVLAPPRCLRADLETCLAPCAGGCSSADYQAQVAATRAFLTGRDVSLLERLETSMKEAAVRRRYELAAQLRDVWEDLSWLRNYLARVEEARQRYSFVYPVTRARGRQDWFVIREAQVAGVVAGPRNGERAKQSAKRLQRLVDSAATSPAVGDADAPDMVLLVAAWFRRYPEELSRTLEFTAIRTLQGTNRQRRPK